VPTPPGASHGISASAISSKRGLSASEASLSAVAIKLQNAWHSDFFTLFFRSYFLFYPLTDPLQAEGVDDESSWRGAGNLVLLAEPQSHQ